MNNFEVVAVENGRLARDELLGEDSDFDLVLLDLMMPEMDGYELLCLMKSYPKFNDIPVIMMSSDGEMQIVASCLSSGAADYILKPIRLQHVNSLRKHVVFKAK
jgi:NIMA (never in mitosis gene a)-related kinase